MEFDDSLKLVGLSTLLFLCQYQGVVFEAKDTALLLQIKKSSKLLGELSSKYDTSSLAKVLV